MDRWSVEEFKEYQRTGAVPGERMNKYNNRRTPYNGTVYDSQREANRAAELELMRQAGEIVRTIEQVPFEIEGGTYIADFVVLYKDGHWEVEDAKGVLTPVYKRSKKQMRERYGIEIKEV